MKDNFSISNFHFQNSHVLGADLLIYYVSDNRPQVATQKSAFHTGKQLMELELMLDATNGGYIFKTLPAQLADLQDLILENIN